jgi:hypothetical protein
MYITDRGTQCRFAYVGFVQERDAFSALYVLGDHVEFRVRSSGSDGLLPALVYNDLDLS